MTLTIRMTYYEVIQSIHSSFITHCYHEETFLPTFARISEASASELLANVEEMLLLFFEFDNYIIVSGVFHCIRFDVSM